MNRVSNTRRLAGVLLCTLLIAACATPPQTKTLLSEPSADLPRSVELKETPFYPQERYQCGPAALATVLGTHGLDVTPDELVDAVYVPALHGSLAEEITATARRYGMLAYPLSPSLQDLLNEVADGHPVLIFQNLGTGWFPRWHFAVVVGYDLESREVVLRSGTTQRWRTTLGVLERTWSRSHYWALVILPAGDIPATAEAQRYLQAAHDLETSNQAAAAQSAYRAATRHWPNEPRVWLAFGNSLYASADYEQAETAFRTVTTLAPQNPQGWNNLAYALLKTSCTKQAKLAASCAARLDPGEPNYRDTLKEISTLASGSNSPNCLPLSCEPPGR